MRIIYLHPHFTTDGGAGRMVIETGRRLVARGHQVDCVCIRADREIVGNDTGIRFHEIGGSLSSELLFWLRLRSGYQRVTELVGQIVEGDADGECILFPQVFPSNWWGSSVLTNLPQLTCVWYCQEPSAFIHSANWIRALPWPKNWIAQALNPLLRLMDLQKCQAFRKVLVNSQYSRRYTQEVYGYDNNRCEVVYLGLDPNRFHVNEAEIRKPWITCVSKLTRFKNVNQVIDAVKRLIDNGNNDVQLHIVGTGDAQLSLQQQASRLGLESCVVFHGRLTDDQMIRLLRQSRGLCLASVDEPFGLVAVEAMACGVPIVAVNSGGPLEIVGQTPAGILIDRPDPALIAQAILQLLDPQHFAARSVAAQSRAADFDWERTVDRLEQIFVHEIVR